MNIILDYDGTVHDCAKIYVPAFRKGYEYLTDRRLAPPLELSDSEISGWLGYSAADMWNGFMPQLDDKYKKICSELVGEEMMKMILDGKSELYSGAEAALEQLKKNGHRLFFLSNCSDAYMQAHRKAHSLDRFYTDYFCTENFAFRPKPEIFPFIKEKYAGDYIIIGDRFLDLQVAEKHGLNSVGCTYGYCGEHELNSADILVNDVSEIPDAVRNLVQKRV